MAAVFDSNGATTVRYSYSPYGELRSQSSSTAEADNDLRYTGGFKVGSVYKLGARYYDPSIGRFTQTDPTGQESNSYGYVSCNPINAKDPAGTEGFLSDCANALLVEFGIFVAIDATAGVTIVTSPTGVGAVFAGIGLSAEVIAFIAQYDVVLDDCF